MANEATIQSALSIVKTDSNNRTVLDYSGRPGAFTGDVNGTKGPAVGAINVPSTGKTLNLDELVAPGYYRIMNQDSTYYVEYGIRDPETNLFYPWGEVLPGESYVGRFSRNLQEEYIGTGTGTGGPSNRVFLKAEEAAGTTGVNVLVEVFER